jgi:hypothetical protein
MNKGIDWQAAAEEVEETSPTEQLDIIGELSSELIKLQAEADQIEEQLKEKKKKIMTLSQTTLPEAMLAINLKSITHESGRKLSVKTFYQAKISDQNKAACFSWLTDSGNESIIKTDVVAKFGKGETEQAKEAQEALEALGVISTAKTAVHHSTLKAFVKEQIESGNADFPQDLFGVYIGNKIEIK